MQAIRRSSAKFQMFRLKMPVWVTKALMRICWWPSAERSGLGFLLCVQCGGSHSGWVLRHIGFWLCQMTEINCCSVKPHCFVRGSAEFKNSARVFSVHHACRAFWKLWVCREVFCCWLNLHSFFYRERCCLAHLLSPQRAGLGVMVRTPAPICTEPAACDALGSTPRSSPVYYFPRSSSQLLSSTEQKHTFALGWFMGWFCVPRLCSSGS